MPDSQAPQLKIDLKASEQLDLYRRKKKGGKFTLAAEGSDASGLGYRYDYVETDFLVADETGVVVLTLLDSPSLARS